MLTFQDLLEWISLQAEMYSSSNFVSDTADEQEHFLTHNHRMREYAHEHVREGGYGNS